MLWEESVGEQADLSRLLSVCCGTKERQKEGEADFCSINTAYTLL